MNMDRRAFSRTGALLASATLVSLFSSATARAEEPGPKVHSVAVLGIGSDDAEEQAEALTTTLRTKVRATAGWSLGEANQSLSMLTAALPSRRVISPQSMIHPCNCERLMPAAPNAQQWHSQTSSQTKTAPGTEALFQ